MKLADEIVINLKRHITSNAGDFIIPNYYVGHFECDLLKITKSGYYYEYEIKVTKSDFKNDKNKNFFKDWRDENSKISKYDLLESGQSRINRFYYVCPERLIKPEEVPIWAGLVYYKGNGDFHTIKYAKLLHKKNAIDYEKISNAFYFRFSNVKYENYLLKQKIKKNIKLINLLNEDWKAKELTDILINMCKAGEFIRNEDKFKKYYSELIKKINELYPYQTKKHYETYNRNNRNKTNPTSTQTGKGI